MVYDWSPPREDNIRLVDCDTWTRTESLRDVKTSARSSRNHKILQDIYNVKQTKAGQDDES